MCEDTILSFAFYNRFNVYVNMFVLGATPYGTGRMQAEQYGSLKGRALSAHHAPSPVCINLSSHSLPYC